MPMCAFVNKMVVAAWLQMNRMLVINLPDLDLHVSFLVIK
jgi:hypothetical protein